MKTLYPALMIFSVSAALCAADGIVFQEEFRKGVSADFITFKKGNVSFDGQSALAVRNGAKFSSRKFRIEPQTPYRLSFSARIDGPGNFEDSPQLEYLFMSLDKAKAGRMLAGWKIRFMDEQGNEVKQKHARFWHYVFSKDLLKYQDEFYSPRDASWLSLEFCAGETEDSLLIADMRIEKIAVLETLNFNPQFKLGKYNYSGFSQVHKGKIIAGKDGDFKLDLSGGWAVSEDIPVKAGEKIKVAVSGKFFKPMGAAFKFNYYDTGGKEISRDHGVLRIPQGEEKEVNYDFIVPGGAASLRFVLGGCVYNRVKITKGF